jgi:fibronectin-binding autotransporter adhesin
MRVHCAPAPVALQWDVVKNSLMKTYCISLLLLASVAASRAQVYTWDGNGTPNNGGNWSTGSNWNPNAPAGDPGAGGDVAVLGDVTSGTRNVIYDSGAGGFLSFLQVDQATAGAINLLSIRRNLTISNAVTLGASAGTEQITVDLSGGSSVTLAASNGLTLNSNGVLALSVTSSSIVGNFTGNLTVSGGTVLVAASTSASSATNTVNGTLTMGSGAISIDNTGSGIQADRRLTIVGDANITGGTISSTRAGVSGQVTLSGSSNTFNPDSFDSDLILTLDRAGDQTLATNQALAGGLLLRGSGVKTVTRTNGSAVSSLSFIDGSSSSSVGTTLKLDSDLTLADGAVQPFAANFGQIVDSGSSVQMGIDTNGFTLNLADGASAGVWTPNKSTQSGVASTSWALSGNGVIRANGFVLDSAGVTTTIGAGLTLDAVGVSGTSTLSGAGAIDAASTFRYSGSAAAGTPYHLVSNRALGNIEVTGGGALQIDNSGGFAIQGATTVSDGTLILAAGVDIGGSSGIALGSTGELDTTAQTAFTMLSAQTIVFTLDGTGAGSAGLLSADGLDITNGSVSFTITGALDDAAYVIATYSGLTGTEFSSVSGLPSGYVIDYNYLGGNQIALVAVPEPGAAALFGAASLAGLLLRRRR